MPAVQKEEVQMSIYSYKVFDEISRSGSFVKASENLNLSPSSVSHIIKSMEDEFGFRLFNRSRAGASLTEEGERILPYVRTLLSAEENIRQEVAGINSNAVGTVKIGLFSSVASNWFVKILHSFKTKYPGIDVVIYQGFYEDILKWLDERRVDIAFITDVSAVNRNFLPLRNDPLICVAPSDYIPKNKFSVTAEDLKENNLIINDECEVYDAKKFLTENGIVPGAYYHIVEIHTLFAMVREGMGVCLVPELIARSAPQNVKKYPIVGNPHRTIGLTVADPNSVSPATKLLKDEIIEFCRLYID